MDKKRASVDGFVPRRANVSGRINDAKSSNRRILGRTSKSSSKVGIAATDGAERVPAVAMRTIGRSDIDESLHNIDESGGHTNKKLARRQKRELKRLQKKTTGHNRKFIKRFAVVLSLIIVIFIGFVGYKFIVNGSSVFQGSIFDFFQNQPLKMDSNGRSNFLVLGTSEDDPGHGGADLTDSMMVVSIDQKNKNVLMFSVPRDLYVEYGEACVAGYAGKINGYFSCSQDGTTKEAEQIRLKKTQKLVGDIFGLDIQYGVHVNHTVIKEAVDAVGGIDVDVQGSNGAPGILDRNFDWRCRYQCYLVKYDNGVHHLDGKHALYLSMARGDIAPTYGLANSNFDREKNQQKILVALKNKAMSTGTLTNIGTVTALMDSFGNNLRTNIQTGEVRTIMDVLSKVKTNDMRTVSLFGENGDGVVTSGPYGGASVVMPSAGIFDYSEIQTFIKKNLNNNAVTREAAEIAVFNGTSTYGLGQEKADFLSDKGFNIVSVSNAPDGKYAKVTVYQLVEDGGKTAEELASLYKVKVKKTTPPFTVSGDIKFLIIFGDGTS